MSDVWLTKYTVSPQPGTTAACTLHLACMLTCWTSSTGYGQGLCLNGALQVKVTKKQMKLMGTNNNNIASYTTCNMHVP